MPATYASIPRSYHIRINETAFLASILFFLGVAVVATSTRLSLRWRHYHRFQLDDYLLLYALLALCATAGVAYTIKEEIYLQIYVGLAWEEPAPDFYDRMLVFEKRVQVCSALAWSGIYAVKGSFLVFFRRLINRLKWLERWWLAVSAFTVLAGLASIPLLFILCPYFGDDYMEHCSIAAQLGREKIYLEVTSSLDCITDALLISIPVMLLRTVRLPLRKKLTLASLLCLSCFMIIIATIRTALAPLPNGVIDTSWLFFWEGMEACIAVIVVSIVSFGGLFRQERRRHDEKRDRERRKRVEEEADVGLEQLAEESEESKESRRIAIQQRALTPNMTPISETHEESFGSQTVQGHESWISKPYSTLRRPDPTAIGGGRESRCSSHLETDKQAKDDNEAEEEKTSWFDKLSSTRAASEWSKGSQDKSHGYGRGGTMTSTQLSGWSVKSMGW